MTFTEKENKFLQLLMTDNNDDIDSFESHND